MTLRLRLLLALVGLVAAGLLIADAATYLSLRSFLLDRVDQQLVAGLGPMASELASGQQVFGPGRDSGTALLPPGTYGQLRDAAGNVLNTVVVAYGREARPVPDLPDPLPTVSAAAPSVTFTTNSLDSRTRFRVLVQYVPTLSYSLIVAIPLSDVQQTLSRLVVVEIVVTIAVLAGMAALAWWLVRRELRPLEDMAAAAGHIAAGDLSERVAPAERKTEVGRLGLALNGMLERIELAFAERKASEERLRRFLADASHELRTPLTSIRGYAEMFRRGARDNPDDLDLAMRRIEEEGRRMGIMVDELLLLARLGEGREPERAPVDLARVLSDAVSDAHAADPEREIVTAAPDTLLVMGDEPQLRQVVANLVANALRHTPARTPVRVTAAAVGRSAVLEVADQGPGMPPEVAARAFEPFFRADPARVRATGGAGLGLAIVAAIVRAHGGTIEVASEPGAGATFTVRLPLTTRAAEPPPLPGRLSKVKPARASPRWYHPAST